MTRGFLTLIGVAVALGLARPALAQHVGDPVPTIALALANQAVMISTTQCGPGSLPAWWVKPFGGMTILASSSPGGPLLATLPVPWPTPDPDPESGWCPGAIVVGPPPGTYWVLMVYGLTTQTSASANDWKQVVVPPRNCVGPPLPPVLTHPPVVNGSSVSLAFSGAAQGCNIDRIDLEVGTTPGGNELGPFPLPGLSTFFPAVPAGTYYTRARGVNAFGKSRVSQEMPITIPGPCAANGLPPTPINPAVTVNGNQVTVAWTLSPATGATFHQIAILQPGGHVVVDHLILSGATSVVANVPSGDYRIRVSAGNACGVRAMVPLSYIDFTVP
jgi:hypothetical protein